ncbi:MAG: cadmium-translocating P-type ATPase [Anaerolineae bacterium]|nr:cadmium-translocating P-type ATPase [Anaerolineae bacterium]
MVAIAETARSSSPAQPEHPPELARRDGPPRLAVALVIITLLALLASGVAERLNAPPALILALNVTSYAAGGYYGLKAAIASLRRGKLDIDLLMILAAAGAALIDQWREGAMLLFLFSLSNVLQEYALGRSRSAIRNLLKLNPTEAKVYRGDKVEVVRVEAIAVGDVVLIEPGERIPVDGVVASGGSAVDQSPITGESMPVDKAPGDKVFAGSLNQQGALDVETTQPSGDTVLSRMIRLVAEAQDSKAPTERFLDRFEEIYAFIVLASVALFIVIPPLFFGVDFQDNFYRAMVLMTVASPCALIISTPAAFLSAIATGARRGVLFKGGAYLEGLAAIKAVAFDKTGTLTKGRPAVTDVVTFSEFDEDQLLAMASAAESRSEHPLAKAMVRSANERGISIPAVEEFLAVPGRGVEAVVDGHHHVRVGSPNYILVNEPHALEAMRALQEQGKTVMLVERDSALVGLVAMADVLRPEAQDVVRTLQQRGVRTAMFTGDHSKVARYMANKLGMDAVRAELMPEDKVQAVQALEHDFGPVAMVGDGVNDAPALASAAIGIAMGAAGTDVALETADVVLMGDRLELIPFAIQLSRNARRVVWINLTFSISVIVVLVISTFLFDLPLTVGVLGHEGSTVIVVVFSLIALMVVPEIKRRRELRQAK